MYKRQDIFQMLQGNYELDKFDIPFMLSQDHSIHKLIPCLMNKERDGYAHFFLDDYRFERVWNQPFRYLPILQSYEGVLSPDFSLFTDFPIGVQITNTYRNRLLGRFWQSKGMKVIPTIGWSNKASFDFCFSGVKENATVAISTVGIRSKKEKQLFMDGYEEMMIRIKPALTIIYGRKKDLPIEGIFFEDFAKQKGWS